MRLRDFAHLVAELVQDQADFPACLDWPAGSHKDLQWRCAGGHTWSASLANRSRGRGCRYCRGTATAPEQSLGALHPNLAVEIDKRHHPNLDAFSLAPRSNKKLHWVCGTCSHEWEAVVGNRTGLGRGCPACAGQVATPTNNLRALFPQIADELDVEKSGVTADALLPKAKTKVWWRCPRGHSYQAMVGNRTRGAGNCSVCAGKIVLPETSLAALHPEIARELDPALNLGVDPWALHPGNQEPRKWRCAKDPAHVWSTTASHRTGRGHGCPSCAGQRATSENNLAVLFPQIAAELDPDLNGGIRAVDVAPFANQVYNWRCRFDPNHVWPALVCNRTGALRSGCAECETLSRTSALEIRIKYLLAQALPVALDQKWIPVAGGTRLEVDIVIPSFQVVVEYDGARWHTNTERDYAKSAILKENGWDVIRVRQAPLCVRPGDVAAPAHPTAHRVADTVLAELRRRGHPGAGALTAAQRRAAFDSAEAVIAALQLQQNRKRAAARTGRSSASPRIAL